MQLVFMEEVKTVTNCDQLQLHFVITLMLPCRISVALQHLGKQPLLHSITGAAEKHYTAAQSCSQSPMATPFIVWTL